MLKCLLVWVLVINTSALTAQNLVPNPSFEFFKKDPCLGRFRTGDEVLEDYIKDWYIPTKGTTDLWNSDSSRKGQCLLYIYDNTKAHSGHYLVGIYTSFKYDTVHFNYTNTPVNTLLEAVDYREYIQIRLTEPLTIGKVYQAKMFAARYRLSNFQTNHLGMLFSEGPIKQTTIKPPILSTPQVNDTIVIADTNWREISQSFVAQRPYSYLTIGNFFNDRHTKIELSGQKTIAAAGSYYYIDDISIEEVIDAPLVNVPNLGVDTTLCLGQVLTIQLPDNSQTRYLWQDGSTSSIRTITQAGTYFVTATTGVYSVTDTLHVRILPPVVLPQDTTLCRGEKLTLIPNYPGHALHWSTGSTDSTLTVSQAGQYWVKVDSHTCPIADTINVQVIDCPDNVPNIFTPNGDGINETFIIDNIELRPWQLAIYNRWGARVFESESYHNQWCGEGLPTGVYYYELFCQPLRRRLKGWVQILR